MHTIKIKSENRCFLTDFSACTFVMYSYITWGFRQTLECKLSYLILDITINANFAYWRYSQNYFKNEGFYNAEIFDLQTVAFSKPRKVIYLRQHML